MSKLLLNKSFSEHTNVAISDAQDIPASSIHFQNKLDCLCFRIFKDTNQTKLETNYYVGVDWIIENELAVHVAPKLNDKLMQLDYLKMLFSCMTHSDVFSFIDDLYEIKFEKPFIEINQEEDLLTPLLIIQFLQVLKTIVRKGLKKSYYKVEHNLKSKIKGKILVCQTIKENTIKNRPTSTYCRYDEFGFNCLENKFLKCALVFIQNYLATFPRYNKLVSTVFNYCNPAFNFVDENIDLKLIDHVAINPFYKEYAVAIHLSKLLFKRFGYNLKEINGSKLKKTKVPPFWIDMPKLFELYVFSLLKNKYHNNIVFQPKGTYGNPDFMLVTNNEKIIIDTKYKRKYQEDKYHADDIRQLSGYARDSKLLDKLGFKTEAEQDRVIDCLIIYPDQTASDKLPENLIEYPIKGFTRFYKIPIKLPVIS